MLKYKIIKLYPTLYSCYVIISKDYMELNDFYKREFGVASYWDKAKVIDSCLRIKAKLKGLKSRETVFAINLSTLKPGYVIHELTHLLFYLNKEMAAELTYEAQEWVANFCEMVFTEIINKKTYIAYDLTKDT